MTVGIASWFRNNVSLGSGSVLLASLMAVQPTHASKLVAPAWDVTVVDAFGTPVRNLDVIETWQDYSCEKESHTVKAITDQRGQVHFPAVYVHRVLSKCLRETASELDEGVHASLGPHVWVTVGDHCVEDGGHCADWTGTPKHMSSQVKLSGSSR